MISYKASVAQICVLFRFKSFNDPQGSLTKPRSLKYVSFLEYMLVNDLLQYINDQSPKFVSYLNSMIVNDIIQCLDHPNMCLIKTQLSLLMPQSSKFVFYLNSMIVNDLLKSLGRSYMFFIDYL